MSATQIFLVPLHDIKTFLKYLEGQGHDLDVIENATLESEWENFCRIKVQQGEE